MSIFDDDDDNDNDIDNNYNPYIDNYYICKRGNKLNIKTQWCCFACERERMKNKYINHNYNFIDDMFFSDDNIDKYTYSKIDPLKICWDILKLIPPKTLNEVKHQYHKLCKLYHPDKGGNTEKFIELKNSYDKLICSF